MSATPELLSGHFLVFDWLGRCLYEDPFETEYVQVYWPWGVQVRGGSAYICPACFISDGGSLPKIVQPVLGNPFSRARPGYCLHDAAYHRVLLCFQPDGLVRTISKEEADELMYFVALKNGMWKPRMKAIWQGVHSFGQSSWDKYNGDEVGASVLLKTYDYTVRPRG